MIKVRGTLETMNGVNKRQLQSLLSLSPTEKGHINLFAFTM